MAVPPSEKSANPQNEEISVTENTNTFNEYLDVDVDELLPTIDELGLNWRLGEKADSNTKLAENILSENDLESYQIESIGVLESVSQKYTKLETSSSWKFWATASLYKFNTADEAFQQWNNIKDFQNMNRAFDIYNETENCRSIQEIHTVRDLHTDLCYVNNILILIEYSTDRGIQFYDDQDDFVILSMILKNMNN